MRSFGVVIALATGCFGPRVPAGVPCDPASPSCPTGQMCVSEAAGHFCETHAIVDASVDAAQTFSYVATVAECVNPTAPDPDKCKQIKGANQLVVDMLDTTTNEPWDAFVRFDLDAAFASARIASVALVLTATDDPNAMSNNSGVVWQVSAFTLADLYSAEPAKVGSSPIAPSRGAVTQLQVLTWPLPTSLVTPGGSVFLGLTTPSEDAANYWNVAGTDPPRLVITIE